MERRFLSDRCGQKTSHCMGRFLLRSHRRTCVCASLRPGQVLGENTAMLKMCKELDFDIAPDPQDSDTCVVKLAVELGCSFTAATSNA